MVGQKRKTGSTDSIKVEESDENLLAQQLVVLRKNWPIVAACALMAAGASLLHSKTLPKLYQATAMLEFDPNAVRPLAMETDPMRGWTSYWDNKEDYETQYRIISSESVLSTVVHDLSLTSDPKFLGLKQPPATPILVEDAAAMLRARITVEPVKTSRLFTVRMVDTDPKQARRLCDAVVRTYISQNLQKSIVQSSDAALWLNGQVDHYKSELESDENQLHEFKKLNELPSSTLEEVSKMIRLEMQAYDESLTHTRTRKQELLARHAELKSVATTGDADSLPASEFLNNVFLQGLRTQYLTAVKERRELSAGGKGENHPLVKGADERVAQIKDALIEEVKNIQGAIDRDLAVIERQEQGESALYEGARKRAVELNMKELEYHRLDRTREQNEKLYGVLLERLKEADLARMMNVNNVRLVDPPLEPKGPFSPRIPLNVSMGVFVGLLVGMALALLREKLDSSLKTPDDVEQKLGVTFLGLLPEEEDGILTGGRNRRRRTAARRLTPAKFPPELVVHERPLSGIAEAARTLRTNLMFMNPDKPYRRLLVTSAAPSEGKTTVACSIAISLAQSGQRVVIVDCDLRRPRLHRVFDRAGDAGLTNVLVGDAQIDDVAQPTVIENLWCVPSGPIPPNPADTLHSESFKKFLADLGDRFDRVIIDSPPLVAVTDSAIISTLVDGVVFVIRAFLTTKALSKQGLRALVDVDAPIAGAVLNAVNLKKANEYNYYQYYYYKREGYQPIPAPTADGSAGSDEHGGAPPPN
jgi:succinoglycan biosynthesis transport protein ExoP